MAISRFRFNERSTATIQGYIQDENGQGVDPSVLTGATLTLYDLDTYAPGDTPVLGIINSRDLQDVNGTNDVDFPLNSPVDGQFVWSVQPEDNVIVTERRQIERHRAVFDFTWATGSFNYECEIEVVNLRSVTA